jgi:adenylate cyclase class 2
VAAGHREVEIKFVIRDLKTLERDLRLAGFRLLTRPTPEINTLYDFPGLPLRRRGELVRIRRYGTTWKLTHKSPGKSGRHKSRIETEMNIEDGEKLAAIFAALELKPSFRYEKIRSEWSDGRGSIVVDRTPIGNFGEIEGLPRWIDSTAKKLGIARSEYITQNYATLFLAWKERRRSPAKEMTFRAVRNKNQRA